MNDVLQGKVEKVSLLIMERKLYRCSVVDTVEGEEDNSEDLSGRQKPEQRLR